MKKLHKQLVKLFRPVEKRIRFVISTFLMIGLMVLSTFFYFDWMWLFFPLLLVITYVLTYLSILEGIEEHEWLMLFLMPLCITAAFYLFYFLFPVRWLTRVPFILLYGFSIYAIWLTSNIFNVGVEKSLQLHRAAFSVNYFYQTIIIFLFINVLLSFRQSFFVNGILTFILIFPLTVQLLWSLKPKMRISKTLVYYGFLNSLLLAEIAMTLSFAPIRPAVLSLFLTASYYSIVGFLYHYMDQRLFKQTVREYIFVLGFVCVIMLLSIQW